MWIESSIPEVVCIKDSFEFLITIHFLKSVSIEVEDLVWFYMKDMINLSAVKYPIGYDVYYIIEDMSF